MTKRTRLSQLIGIAVCNAQDAISTGRLQLFPAGQFDAPEGSMLGLTGPWNMSETIAAAVIERIQRFENDIVIDYEHQTLLAAENGQPAPAAGWIKRDDIHWIAGKGLYAFNVEWTEEAKSMLEGKKYKYFSPVFAFNKTTGDVLDLRMGALTNNPAIKSMDEALAAATAQFLPNNQPEDTSMNEELLKALGLKKDASEADAIAACSAMTTKITELEAKLSEKDEAIAAAKAGGKSANEAIAALQAEVAALTNSNNESKLDEMIAAATSKGQLIPAQEEWARNLGVDGLKEYLELAPEIAALIQTQTKGKKFDDGNKLNLTDSQLATCKTLGIKPEDYAATLAAEENV